MKKRKIVLFITACAFASLLLSGCGNEARPELTTAAPVDQTTMIDDYVEAYEKVDYRAMWKLWPQDIFGGKASIFADMKKDIFRNYYSSKAGLVIDRGEITAGSAEDEEAVLKYFASVDMDYITDLYRMDYTATVTGGKRDGEKYKTGVIYAFRYGGKWFVYDDSN